MRRKGGTGYPLGKDRDQMTREEANQRVRKLVKVVEQEMPDCIGSELSWFRIEHRSEEGELRGPLNPMCAYSVEQIEFWAGNWLADYGDETRGDWWIELHAPFNEPKKVDIRFIVWYGQDERYEDED